MTDTMVRKIGPWILGRTLGQGGFGWVKEGVHEKSGKLRAMKFMLKGANWNKKDEEEARNEIEALSKIKHKNVVGFFGFDFNCMYPMKEGDNVLTVMFEFELASGGDLFDIIFFNPGGLREDVTRYYFRQLIQSVKACHDGGVVHRDIKPQNLLLDKRWQLKLADFGLAKIFEADCGSRDDCKADDMIMTTYRGTPGYRAPEIELGRSYTSSCDVFSCGVALFVLLTGYPPFKAPLPNDYWYQPLTRGNVRKFWRRHKHDRLSGQVKDLLTGMFHFDGAKRLTMDQIVQHPWFKSEVISQEKLVPTLKRMRSVALANYWKDPKRSKMNQQSVKGRPHQKKVNGTRDHTTTDKPSWMQDQDWFSMTASVRKCIKQMNTWDSTPPPLPPNRVAVFTEFTTKTNAQEVIACLVEFICETGGRCEFDDKSSYHVMGKIQAENWAKTGFELMEISVHVYSDPVNKENVVVLKRLQGAQVEFSKVFAMIMQKLIVFWTVDEDALIEVKKLTVSEGTEQTEAGEATTPLRNRTKCRRCTSMTFQSRQGDYRVSGLAT